MIEIETNSELDKAAEKFFNAALEYRSFIKRHHPQILGGVIWVRRGNESVAYSECDRYTRQLASMAFDSHSDKLIFTEAADIAGK